MQHFPSSPSAGGTSPNACRRRSRSTSLLFLLAGAVLVAAPAAAQQAGAVTGTVVAEGTRAPVAGAQVTVTGTRLGSVTDASGRFRIANITTGPEVTLDVRRIGFAPAQQTATVGGPEVTVTLRERSVELQEVTITGTAGAVQKKELGNTVATINAADITKETQVNSLQQLINGRAPGVVIQPASGAVGAGARVRVRGSASLSLSNEPLLYVDGVRVNNAASGPANQAFGSTTISRFNDINPDDIESIEIIKGPAAATLYGTEASNGVIQIITKRGAVGAPRWNLTVRQGQNFFMNPEGRIPQNWRPDSLGNLETFNIVSREAAAGRPIFTNGWLQEYDLNVSGGTEKARYFAGGTWQRDEGVEPSNLQKRGSGRLNLSLMPSDKLTIDANVGYVSGRLDLGAEAGYGGRMWTTVLADPTTANTPRRGFYSGLPEEYDVLYNIWQDLNRFTGSIRAEHRPTSWFTQRLSVGLDRTREQNVEFTPRVDSLRNSAFGDEALGFKAMTDRQTDYKTVDYAGTASFDVTKSLRSQTSVGGQYYKNGSGYVYAEGSVFPAQGLSSIAATTQGRFNDEDFVEDATLGFFVQEQLGWNDRLFITGAVRSDDNSAFGKDFDRVYYPKVSASWVLSDESFWHVPWVNTLRLRGAYGEAGKQPQTFAAIATFQPVTGFAGLPALTPQFVGNPDLGPERGKEIEVGFDAGLLNDRAGIEFTYYNKRTTDAILERQMAPSLGYPGLQFFNAGEVRNSGVELMLRGRPVESENLALDLNFSLATNSNKLVSFGDESVPYVDVSTVSQQQHRVGYALGSFFEERVLSAQFDTAGKAINLVCDDGHGGSMPCLGADGTYGTADDAPRVYQGQPTPKVEGALSGTLSFLRNFRLYTLVDFKTGMKKFDGNRRVRCLFFGGRCRENFVPEDYDPALIAQIQSNQRYVGFLIQDASFAKLREVSLSYTLPTAWVSRANVHSATLSIAGRNLHTWTKYSGIEPEAMFMGGTRGGNFGMIEQTTLPQLSQWVFTVNVGF
ncbi:MAG TPA: TonB-dependent receptor [Gemmatimonadaceae bacterium]|nr:TonB-dependent receptor [Gemmatimonadaceae bacterium]